MSQSVDDCEQSLIKIQGEFRVCFEIVSAEAVRDI